MPDDYTLHAYKGSTTKEKIITIQKYTSRYLEIVIRQIGIYAPLKNESATPENLFADLITLVEDIRENLEPTLLQSEVLIWELTELNEFIHE